MSPSVSIPADHPRPGPGGWPQGSPEAVLGEPHRTATVDHAGHRKRRVQAADGGGQGTVVGVQSRADGRPADLDRAQVELETQVHLDPHRAPARAGPEHVEEGVGSVHLPTTGVLHLERAAGVVEVDHVQARLVRVDGQHHLTDPEPHRLAAASGPTARRCRCGDHCGDGVVDLQAHLPTGSTPPLVMSSAPCRTTSPRSRKLDSPTAVTSRACSAAPPASAAAVVGGDQRRGQRRGRDHGLRTERAVGCCRP